MTFVNVMLAAARIRHMAESTQQLAERREIYAHTHTNTCLTALFRDYPGKPVPER